MPVQAAPPAAPMTWTGFYIGANAGGAWGHSDPTLTGNPDAPPLSFGPALSAPPGLAPRGFIGGAQAGYNWQSGQAVFGAEVDFSGLDAKADASLSPFFSFKGTQRLDWSSRYDWLFTARLRGGFLVAPNWLLYATGGLAVTHVKDSVVCTSSATLPIGECGSTPPGSSVTWSESKTLTGGTIGGGIETMFAPNWTARVEYLFARFKDTTPPVTSFSGFTSVAPSQPLFSFNHNLNIVRFAINYKFGL
jgi:outer membrane immunogenic protein